MLRLISWNVNKVQPWPYLGGCDVALLQELREPPPPWRHDVVTSGSSEGWSTAGWKHREFQAVVARISNRVEVSGHRMADLAAAHPEVLNISRPGSLAAAEVRRDGQALLTAVSMYATWEKVLGDSAIEYADASAHNLISDLAPLVHNIRGHRIIAAGDLNILRGYGEGGSPYWGGRYQTVFDRFEAMGLTYIGPEARDGVMQADPWPEELPPDSRNVPTFRPRPIDPSSGTRQLDFVFASTTIADRVSVVARNTPQEWGPSDHCQIQIDVDL